MALHSKHNDIKCRIACGLPMIPFRSKQNSSFTLPTNDTNKMDIIDEAFIYFRVNVLFKNYQIQGNGDRVLVYLFVLISYLFKQTQTIKDKNQANKRLLQISNNPLPKDKNNFLSFMLQDGSGQQRKNYLEYIKQIRTETIKRFLEKFYLDGIITQDFKFWVGLSKKKFMGLNYSSMF